VTDLLLTLGMLAVAALLFGAVRLWKPDRRRAVLMAIAAAVIFANIVLWSTMPAVPAPPL
jgi:uncharacterized membrane protein YccC